MKNKLPRRAHTLEIKLGADTKEELQDALFNLALNGVGTRLHATPSCGWDVKYSHDPEMTHEKYFQAIEEWREANKEEKN